jgi:RNA polymerase sigma factor (sigma-70 family)
MLGMTPDGSFVEPFFFIWRLRFMAKITSLFRHDSADDFERLLSPHIERLFRLAYRYCGEVAQAEDLVQDLLLKLYPKRKELCQIEALSPWLARSLYNHFIDTTRKGQRSPLTGAVSEEVLHSLPSGDSQPEQELERSDLQCQLEHAMTRLSPEQRALISLHDIEGYTLHELETMLETPIGTLKSRLHRGRLQLRNALQVEPLPETGRVDMRRTENEY